MQRWTKIKELQFTESAQTKILSTWRSYDCKDCGGKYFPIRDEEDPRLTMFDKRLPCCGCGIGWSFFLLGFLCPLMWYVAATFYACKYYRRDPRERIGLAASAIAALLCTFVTLIALAAVLIQLSLTH